MFHNAKWTTKFYIAISGILVNFITAWLILFTILSTNGVNVPTLEIANTGDSVQGNVNSPSVAAGLIPGDTIVMFSRYKCGKPGMNLVSIIEENPGKEVSISFLKKWKSY